MKRFLGYTLAACLALTATSSIATAVISDAQKHALKQALGGTSMANTLGDEITTGANAIATVTPGTAKASSPVVLDSSKGVTGLGTIQAASFAPVNGTAFTAADPNPSRATLRAASYFCVDTTANAVDLDFSNDADLEAADIGKSWIFAVCVGGTNALTVTDGASGVVVKPQAATTGTTAEDVGDYIACTAYALEGVICTKYAAD